MEGGTYEIFEL